METNTSLIAQNFTPELSLAKVTKPKGSRRLRKKNYEKINDDIRKEIIVRVTIQQQKLKTVCEHLNINVSSAKNVLAIYKKEGRIEKKKYRVKRKKNIETSDLPQIGFNNTAVSVKQPLRSPSSGTELTDYTTSFGNVNNQEFTMNFSNDLAAQTHNLSVLLQDYCLCDANIGPAVHHQEWPAAYPQYSTSYPQMMPY